MLYGKIHIIGINIYYSNKDFSINVYGTIFIRGRLEEWRGNYEFK